MEIDSEYSEEEPSLAVPAPEKKPKLPTKEKVKRTLLHHTLF